MIKAQIIADSVNIIGQRITTWILTYPRFIHAEFMTHRAFSRNAASSRAIPIAKMLAAVNERPAAPEYWGANQKGMQAAVELTGEGKSNAIQKWIFARDGAVNACLALDDCDLHKQITNRVIEPWSHITVLATATTHGNFFALRAHKDAQPEFQVLAYTMLREYLKSKPVFLDEDEWHIPFSDKMVEGTSIENRLKIATARAARISYLTFEGAIDVEKDYELHDRLAASGHWSPFEHCAQNKANHVRYGNFIGWMQYRKKFTAENRDNITTEDLARIFVNMPDWVTQAINQNDSIKPE